MKEVRILTFGDGQMFVVPDNISTSAVFDVILNLLRPQTARFMESGNYLIVETIDSKILMYKMQIGYYVTSAPITPEILVYH